MEPRSMSHTRPIELFLCHRNELTLDALSTALSQHSNLRVIGRTSSHDTAMSLLEHTPSFDIAIIDLSCGIGLAEILLTHSLSRIQTGVIALADKTHNVVDLARFLELGGSAIVWKHDSLERLIATIEQLQVGVPLLSPQETLHIMRRANVLREEQRDASERFKHLTSRERDVLMALGEGLNDQQIALQLHVSHETVRSHMVSILRKFNLNNRLEALLFALRFGFVSLPER